MGQTLCQAEATRWVDAWTTFANTDKAWAYRQDQLPSTHPIVAEIHDLEDVEVNFDGITYAKGASVLKQLVAWVGREEFLAGIRGYFRASTSGATPRWPTCSASWRRPRAVTSRPGPSRVARRRRRQHAAALFEVDGEGRSSFAVEQGAPDAWPTLRSHRLAIGLYSRSDSELVCHRPGRARRDGARTEVPELSGARSRTSCWSTTTT